MKKNSQKQYSRMTKAERASIERSVDRGESARTLARNLGRSPSTVADEVKRNRTVSKGLDKGQRVTSPPKSEKLCPRLTSWPWVCNGCKYRRYRCSYRWRCEYSATRAQALADGLLRDARKGVNSKEGDFEAMMDVIRSDVQRGLSPAQIATGRASEFKVHPSTIYRWIAAGYGGMSNIELRRKVGYKPRRMKPAPKMTAHGASRSYAAFLALDKEGQARACEMDIVIGRARDTQCILTLYLRPFRFQLALLLPDKTSSAVVSALDALEHSIGKKAFQRLFGLILTDNGAEFSDHTVLERSALGGDGRCIVYYCDPRQSQQKGGCERNHVELRKLLPKGQGISFDELDAWDAAVVMSHLNSQPRPSLMGASPLSLLRAALQGDAEALLDPLGIKEIPYESLLLNPSAIDAERAMRQLPPLRPASSFRLGDRGI